MTETCSKCDLLDDSVADDMVTCALCSSSFHGHCVDVPPDLIVFLNNRIDLSWSCNACVGEPEKLETKQCLNVLMRKVSSMAEDIEALKAKATPKPSFANVLRNNLETPKSAKRRIGERSEQSVKRPRVVTPAVIIGSGIAADDLKPVAPLKWLYVSRLDPQTCEEAVTKKLSGALNVEPKSFKCVKLVPKMADPTFISFKVGMSEDLLQRSLAPEVWPPGIAVREFVNRPRHFFGPPVVRL
jgi:PHD-finger